MEALTAKGANRFKFNEYEITIVPFGQKKLGITVIDALNKVEFKKQMLELQHIGTNTLLKAFNSHVKEIKYAMEVNAIDNKYMLQIDVVVASQFLKPVKETIMLEQTSSISESQLIANSIARLSDKLRQANQKEDSCKRIICNSKSIQEKLYSQGNSYEPIAKIQLPRGKYLITLSFLLKTNSQWMYLYAGNGQQVIDNSGFYVSQNQTYIPITVRKPHVVNTESEEMSFTTYYSQAYSFSLKNTVITAQKIPD